MSSKNRADTTLASTARLLAAPLLVGMLWLLGGCGGVEPEDETIAEEEIGSTSSALCQSSAANVSFHTCTTSSATSPTTSYGQSCSNYYAVNVTGTYGKTFSIVGNWGQALPTTQASCIWALANVSAYKWVWGAYNCSGMFCQFGYHWKSLGSTLKQGKWYSCSPGVFCWKKGCYLESTDAGIPKQYNSNSNMIRVEAKAYTFFGYRRVEAGVRHFDGSCVL